MSGQYTSLHLRCLSVILYDFNIVLFATHFFIDNSFFITKNVYFSVNSECEFLTYTQFDGWVGLDPASPLLSLEYHQSFIVKQSKILKLKSLLVCPSTPMSINNSHVEE